MLPLVTAGDGGGSIRIPASFTGCFGLKTSYGRIPREPEDHWEYGATAVYGPLTKTVADAALFLDQVVGTVALDPYSLPHPGCSYVARAARALPPALRIGFSPDLGYAVVQSDVAAAVEDAVQVFERLGHRVEPHRRADRRSWDAPGACWARSSSASRLREAPRRVASTSSGAASSPASRWPRQMTPGAVGRSSRRCARDLNAWCAERVRPLRSAGDADRALRSLPGARAVSRPRPRGAR